MPSRFVSSLCFATAFSLGVGLAAITCGSVNVVPGLGTGASSSACAFPRGCYLVQNSGALQGQCADCTGGPERCRLYFIPTPGVPVPFDLGGVFAPAGSDLGGTGLPIPGGGLGPDPTDQSIVCSLYMNAPADQQAVCAVPETLCVARGAKCASTGHCVRAGASCESGVPYSPQHRPGTVGTDTYCPYTDDVCCPAQSSADGGTDGAGPPDDAAPADATIG